MVLSGGGSWCQPAQRLGFVNLLLDLNIHTCTLYMTVKNFPILSILHQEDQTIWRVGDTVWRRFMGLASPEVKFCQFALDLNIHTLYTTVKNFPILSNLRRYMDELCFLFVLNKQLDIIHSVGIKKIKLYVEQMVLSGGGSQCQPA